MHARAGESLAFQRVEILRFAQDDIFETTSSYSPGFYIGIGVVSYEGIRGAIRIGKTGSTKS